MPAAPLSRASWSARPDFRLPGGPASKYMPPEVSFPESIQFAPLPGKALAVADAIARATAESRRRGRRIVKTDELFAGLITGPIISSHTMMSSLNIRTLVRLARERGESSNSGVARRKQTISFSVHPELADRFREATKEYYGKLGLCFSAGMLMWLEADPEKQAAYLKRVFEAEVNDEMLSIIEQAKGEQLKRIKSREDGTKSKRGS